MKKNKDKDNVLCDIDDVFRPSPSHFKLNYNPFEEDPEYGKFNTPGHHRHSSKLSPSSSSYSPNSISPKYDKKTFVSPPNSPGMMRSQSLPSISEPENDNIRMKIKEAVHNSLWTEKLHEEYNEYMNKLKKSINKSPNKIPPRCVVCTLPYGTCIHTEDWLKEEFPGFTLPTFEGINSSLNVKKSNIESEIDDVLGLIENAELKVDTKPLDNDIDIDGSRWIIHEPRRSDKIGSTYIALFTPSPRGWHTTVEMLDNRIVVVYG